MIRILQIVSSTSTVNGVMQVIMNYYRHIDRQKVQFDFLYFDESKYNFDTEIKELGGALYKINKPSLGHTSRHGVKNFFRRRGDNYIAIHCHDIFGAAVFGRAARSAGIPHVIQHSHTTKFSDKSLSAIRNYLMLAYGERYITEHMACSQAALNIFNKKKLRDKSSIVLYNAIDLDHFCFSSKARREVRKQFDIGQNDFVVGNIARFAQQKNHQLLLESFARLNARIPNAKLLLVGDGPLKAQIMDTAKTLGLGNRVIFAGACQDPAKFYSAFDVFALTSHFEGLVVSGIESQANGLPTICSPNVSDETRASRFFHKYQLDDPEHVAKEILSKRHLRSKSINKCDISSKYDISKQATRLENFYLSLNNAFDTADHSGLFPTKKITK